MDNTDATRNAECYTVTVQPDPHGLPLFAQRDAKSWHEQNIRVDESRKTTAVAEAVAAGMTPTVRRFATWQDRVGVETK